MEPLSAEVQAHLSQIPSGVNLLQHFGLKDTFQLLCSRKPRTTVTHYLADAPVSEYAPLKPRCRAGSLINVAFQPVAEDERPFEPFDDRILHAALSFREVDDADDHGTAGGGNSENKVEFKEADSAAMVKSAVVAASAEGKERKIPLPEWLFEEQPFDEETAAMRKQRRLSKKKKRRRKRKLEEDIYEIEEEEEEVMMEEVDPKKRRKQ